MNRVIEFHNTENSKAVEFYNKRRQIYFNFNKYSKKKLNKNGTTIYVCAANQECKVSLTLGINNIITRLPDETAHFEHLPQTYVEIDIEIKLARLVDEVPKPKLEPDDDNPEFLEEKQDSRHIFQIPSLRVCLLNLDDPYQWLNCVQIQAFQDLLQRKYAGPHLTGFFHPNRYLYPYIDSF